MELALENLIWLSHGLKNVIVSKWWWASGHFTVEPDTLKHYQDFVKESEKVNRIDFCLFVFKV